MVTYTLLDNPRQETPLNKILKLSISNVATCFAYYFSTVFSTLVVSSLTASTEVAAYGLANLIWNLFGMSFGSGLTSALDSVVGQSVGAGNHHLPPIHLNRARIVIMTVALVPGLIILFFTKEILVAVGQDAEVAQYSSEFITGASYGLLPLYMNLCSAAFLRSLQLPNIPLLANVVSALVHIGPCIWLVDRYGLYGAGIATALNSWTRSHVHEIYKAHHPEQGAHPR
jgi:MATE family multidrug resistance protein